LFFELGQKGEGRIMVIIGFYLLLHFTVLFHIMIYKSNPGKVTESKFLDIDKRFSKSEMNKFSPELKKLLSYSHVVHADILKHLDTEDVKEYRKCDICEDMKPL
jgi:hypothetical protein